MPTSTTTAAATVAVTSAPDPQAEARKAEELKKAEEASNLRSTKLVGSVLFVLIFVLATALVSLTAFADPKSTGFTLAGLGHVNRGQVLVLGVIVAGALGGCIHVGTSFSDYVGTAKYKSSWQWWYLLRPFIGSALSLAFYFLIRGGLLSLTSGDGNAEPSFYGMVGISFLVGMFSKQATDKLDDVFDTLFKSNKDNERTDGLEPNVPVLSRIEPAEVVPGTANQKVVLVGSNFAGAQLRVNGAPRTPQTQTDDRIEYTFPASDLAAPGTYTITVANSAGVASAALEFKVIDRRTAPEQTPAERGQDGSDTTSEQTTTQPAVAIDVTTTQIGAAPATVGADGNANASTDSGESSDTESNGGDESDGSNAVG